jgi:hypothetical protein
MTRAASALCPFADLFACRGIRRAPWPRRIVLL